LKSFTVTATDLAGNTTSQTVTYTVAYQVCALYDQSKSYKAGSTVPLKLQLCDTNSANFSSSSLVVHAIGLTKIDNTASNDLASGTPANPDNNFRYDPALGGSGGYIYNLSTKGLSTGTWAMDFTVTGYSQTHRILFDLK
jgi:hypothetical protein